MVAGRQLVLTCKENTVPFIHARRGTRDECMEKETGHVRAATF